MTNSLNSITLNDDDVEDHIDNSTAYIVVVDFDEVSGTTGGVRNSSSCEGGWTCDDKYCDSICGEFAGCLDCNNLYNKRLILEKIRINDDVRTTKGATTVIDKHFVSSLGSRYRLGLNAVVLHANGKFDAINNGRIEQKWKKKEVKRVKLKSSGVVSRGTSVTKEVNLDGEPSGGILLSNFFNIQEAKIYINIYERDFPFGGVHDFFAPSYNGLGISNAQHWRSSSMPSLTGPAKAYYYHNLSLNPAIFDLPEVAEEVLPADWVNAIQGKGYQTLEITRGNVTFSLRVIDK